MARRRSARIASANKAAGTTAAAPNLSSVAERDESPVPEVHPSIDSVVSSPPPCTPSTSSPVKPPMSEMHPSKVHPTMAPPSSALRLGFTDIKKPSEEALLSPGAAAALIDQGLPRGLVTSTPSKTTLASSDFTFRYARPSTADLGLSEDAQKMMEELREEAQKIKADLIAKREQDKELEEEALERDGRKIARPKGKAGRFSAAHMAEFKKMDSIANHPSAFRAQPKQQQQPIGGKLTPLTKGVKRTQSKANLHDAEPAPASARVKVPTVSVLAPTSFSPVKRPNPLFGNHEPPSAVKRARQRLDDDASSGRPVSRDGSSIPRPTTAGKDGSGIPRSQSSLAALMSPTKSSLAKSNLLKSQISGLIPQSSSKTTPAAGLKKSVTTSNLVTEQKPSAPVRSPGRFDRVKSILRGQKNGDAKGKSSLPVPSASSLFKTPSTLSLNKPLPAVPATTPSRKLVKRVVFTPDAKKAAIAQTTPTPIKPGIPRSKTHGNLPTVCYPSLGAVNAQAEDDNALDEVMYPDLSSRLCTPSGKASKHVNVPAEMPGTFTFRSDHTISFGSASPSGFGASRGQASVRHVRPSMLPNVVASMPGSFPASVTEFRGCGIQNKENKDPLGSLIPTIKHGLENKKRHRPTADEEEDGEREAAERAAKKQRREPVPDSVDALFAPRLVGGGASTAKRTISSVLSSPPKKPSEIPGIGFRTPNQVKKKPTLSLSRLNMLARPKNRK